MITQLNVQQIEAQSNAKDADSDEQIVAWQNELEDATTKLSELQAELSEKKTVAEGSSDAAVPERASPHPRSLSLHRKDRRELRSSQKT